MAVAETSTRASSNLIRTSVPNLISGVSQQADTFKLTSQANEQINAISSVVNGLTKRPGTEWIADLSYGDLVPLKYFWINKSSSEQFLGVLLNNTSTNAKSMKIYNLSGVEQSVYEYTAGSTLTNYFSGATEANIQTLTIADYTFFLNTAKTTAVSNDLTSRAVAGNTQVYQGMIVVKQGYSGRDRNNPSGKITWNYKIVSKAGVTFATGTGNSGTGHVSDPSGGTDGFDAFKATDGGNTPVAIAKALVAGLNVVAGTAFAIGNYRIFSEGSNVYIQHESVDFDIVTDDGYGQTLFYAIKDEVQNFSDLPTIAPHRFVTKIAGLPEDTGDEYYVSHISSQPNIYSSGTDVTTPKGIKGISDGYWEESVAPGITYKLDPASMPHALIKIDTNKFLFTPVNGDNTKSYGGTAFTQSKQWGDRVCGDAEFNPWPSFVGKTINNLFFFKNRLGILSGENVILSEAGEFFNFLRTTMTQLLDSDPVDISSSTTEIGTLYHAIPFYDRLVLFAEKMQFSLQAEGELTAKSVSLQQTTAFDVNINATPVTIGNKIYFSFNRSGSYSGIQEYFINPNTILLDGVDISSNIPTYLEGKTKLLVGSEIENILLVLKDSIQNEVGVYKFFYSGDEKIQSSWSKFNFGLNTSINFANIFSGKIYFVVTRNSKVTLESLNLDESHTTFNTGSAIPQSGVTYTPFRLCLDKILYNFAPPNRSNSHFQLLETGTITDQGSYHATSTSVAYRIYQLTNNNTLKNSQSWSAGTQNSSSGYFKNPTEEIIVASDGTSFQGFFVYRNSSTQALQFNSTGVISPNQIMIKSTTFVNNVPIFNKIPGNDAQFNFYLGLPYTMTYSLSRPVIKSSSGRGQSSVLDGRLQIRNGILNYYNTRFFQIKVTPKYKDTYTYTYLYKLITDYLGVGPTNLDYINFDEGSYKFPVFTNSEELQVIIENSSPYVCSLLSLEWEALYSARSKRIG